ncbi:hypothetical protein K2173_021841 [Erythroxylum novogranatense]|uniref:DNA mismatch repair proteins mutS family domain-containing protein n=1 Tax=Erythroxylum novogranatense TaxID=1862640 RepID=A0AAV8T3G1_9ROSI|nr:hypothetical protein K2173_021841 [Erythroxylum novogranatense]
MAGYVVSGNPYPIPHTCSDQHHLRHRPHAPSIINKNTVSPIASACTSNNSSRWWCRRYKRSRSSSGNGCYRITRPGGFIKLPKQVIRRWCYCSCSNSASTSTSTSSFGSTAHYNSLRVLEWDKFSDLVASFASTSLARQTVKAQLWSLNRTYEASLRLLEETNAAVEMQKHATCRLDFTSIDSLLVKSAIQRARRGLPVAADEAVAVASMLDSAHYLQFNLKAAVKQNADCFTRFMPLAQEILELVVSRSLLGMIRQVIDEDGTVKDSASSALKQSRNQVRVLEKKLHQFMDGLLKNEYEGISLMEVSNIEGRWCIKSTSRQLPDFKGLLMPSNSGVGSILEPLDAVPLNDELQRARASVAKAEADVLMMLTEKMQMDLGDIEKIFNSIIRLDSINARATYSLSFGGVCPNLYLPHDINGPSCKRDWLLYMPKAYHPFLLQQHRQNQKKSRKSTNNVAAVIDIFQCKGETDENFLMHASEQEQAHPVPVDFFISQKTRVLIITGPNTGGKTICLKTVGLACLMAKSGIYVLSTESIQIPWFDSVFADIGDEQSLSQSLSTFSGHLKQISDIRSQSTSLSLVLLDEVGAGTNPLEGAALGMSLLESFADTGALLTVATTHHGELKSLKYSNNAIENACMEFDELNLKPTYKILWGVPGRSNAINICEKLGLPSIVLSCARELYGGDSEQINEIIMDMEKFKQGLQQLLCEAQYHLMLSRTSHESLLLARRKLMEHGMMQKYRKLKEVSETATVARSILHKKVRQVYAYTIQSYQPTTADQKKLLSNESKCSTAGDSQDSTSRTSSAFEAPKKSVFVRSTKFPEVGETVQVPSLGKEATVLRVDPSRKELLVQAGNMKLKVKLADIGI